LSGVIATAGLTALMIATQLAGPTRLDLPPVLGTLLTADPNPARVAGFLIHLTAGQGFERPTTAPAPRTTQQRLHDRQGDQFVVTEPGRARLVIVVCDLPPVALSPRSALALTLPVALLL